MTKFIATYHKEVNRFTSPGGQQPVVILYDNDSGAGGIKGIIKEFAPKHFGSGEPFVRIVRNLYAVPTPPTAASQQSKIEDFFEPELLVTKLDGKTFSDGNKFDPEKHYGKNVFAHKVVRPNAETINFHGFVPVLTNIVAAITSHMDSSAKTTGA